MGAEDHAWAKCAARLGLDVRRPTPRLHRVDNFGSMVRALGGRASDPSIDDWMCGAILDVPMLVHVRHRRKKQRVVEVIAAIDPFLGVGLQATTAFGLLAPRVALGHPPLDERFAITALDTDAARRLFADTRGTWDGADALVRLAVVAREVTATDNLVSATLGIDEIHTVDAMSWLSTALAEASKALGASRAALPWHPSMPIDAWASFATSAGLALDRPRFKISGTLGGANVELRLQTADGVMYGAARVAFASPLGLGLRLVGRSDGTNVEYDEDWEDIEVGDAAFDEAFVVNATDASRARTILGVPAVRARALALLARTIDLVVLDTHLSAALRAADLYDARFLGWLLDELTALARDLVTASRGPSAPYR